MLLQITRQILKVMKLLNATDILRPKDVIRFRHTVHSSQLQIKYVCNSFILILAKPVTINPRQATVWQRPGVLCELFANSVKRRHPGGRKSRRRRVG